MEWYSSWPQCGQPSGPHLHIFLPLNCWRNYALYISLTSRSLSVCLIFQLVNFQNEITTHKKQKFGRFYLVCMQYTIHVCFAPQPNWWQSQQTLDAIKKLPWSSQRVRPSLWGLCPFDKYTNNATLHGIHDPNVPFFLAPLILKRWPKVICLLW